MKEQLLAYFRAEPDAYLSGEQLSRLLQCSRTAVWKHIQELKEQGYRFSSARNKGYKLLGAPDELSPAVIMKTAGGIGVFTQLYIHDTLDSTQSEAHRRAASGANHGTLIVAERQTAGRGRHGRSWYSPPGKGVWMSLLLRPQLPLHAAPQLTIVAAVALCRTTRKTLGADVGIKWPNDLLIEGHKISGILVDSVGEDERVRYLIVGVGIDCNFTADDYSPELAVKATSLLLATGKPIDRSQLIADFLREFDELYRLYIEYGFAPIRTLWESLSVTLGKPVRLQQTARVIIGIAEAMDDTGALLVREQDGTLARIYTGETVETVPTTPI